MPLSTYDELQTSILSWLARPGDPLVSPAVPDMIQLFEREATRRLKVGGAEKRASLTALSAAVALPADFGELRLATSGGVVLSYVTPMQLPDGGGPPAHYTIIGNELRLGPSPTGGCTIEIVYQSGVPPLSDSNPSNWLLSAHPDCYLFGSLVEAESFIGSDDRIPLWAQRREAAFSSIESADRKARWGGAPLSIRAEGVSGGNGTAAGDWTSAPPVPIPIAGIVAGDGLTGGGSEGIVTVSLATPVAVSRGGTGGATAADARLNLGAAPLDSPIFTGDARLTSTPAPGDSDTSIATTGFVQAALIAQALAGDVTGPTSNTAVVRLQGRPVANTAPSGSQVLQWSGTAWGPASIAGSGTVTSISAGAGITVTPSPIVGAGSVALTVPVSVANGGTGSTTAPAALTSLGATAADNLRVLKAGDTMTGPLLVNSNITLTGDLQLGTGSITRPAGTDSVQIATAAGANLLQIGLLATTSFANNNFTVFGGAMIGAPTGGNKGAGTLNAEVIYQSNVPVATGLGAPNPGTSGGIPYYSSATGLASTAAMTANALIKGGGAGSPPIASTATVDGTGNLATTGNLQLGGGSITRPTAADSISISTAAATNLTQIGLLATTSYANVDWTVFGNTQAYGGVVVGSPTGGNKGAGTVNATGVYANNVLLTSDISAKQDIAPLPDGCLSLVRAIGPKSFHWASTPVTVKRPDSTEVEAGAPSPESLNRGFIAQDVVAVLGGKDDSIDLGGLVAVLWKAVQELTAEVAALQGGAPAPQRRRQ